MANPTPHPRRQPALCWPLQTRRALVGSAGRLTGRARARRYDDVLPFVRRLVETFGARRLMWATDCPYQLHQHEPAFNPHARPGQTYDQSVRHPPRPHLKFTGLTQNLGQLQGPYRDFQSN
jgi:hypothetical protein